MNSGILRLLRVLPLAGVALLLACGGGATSPPATPTPTLTPHPASPTPSGPVATPTPESASSPTATFTPGDIGPISAAQLEEELKSARFPTSGWKTNFRLRNIHYSEILSGGPGKDDIPAIDRPAFQPVADADQWLEDREPVQAVDINGDARAYPLQIMVWHEIVNDTVGGEPVVITY